MYERERIGVWIGDSKRHGRVICENSNSKCRGMGDWGGKIKLKGKGIVLEIKKRNSLNINKIFSTAWKSHSKHDKFRWWREAKSIKNWEYSE